MGLKIECDEWEEYSTGEMHERSWYVRLTNPFNGNESVVIAGFQRRIDAEIAMKSLLACGVDWSLPKKQLQRAITQIGGRDAVTKIACEHLQW